MKLGRLEVVRGVYTSRRWWRYWRPRRLTLKRQAMQYRLENQQQDAPATYCWLGFNFGWSEESQ
jgi:hypothetical protein